MLKVAIAHSIELYSQDAVDRYIKAYERVKGLYKKHLDRAEIKR